MRHHGGPLAESTSADLTRVRFLSRVSPDVAFQILRGSEFQVTMMACKGSAHCCGFFGANVLLVVD